MVRHTRAVDVGDLAILVEAGGISQGEKETTGGPLLCLLALSGALKVLLPGAVPGKLVSEGVTGALGGGETTAVREERGNLSTFVVDLLNGLDGVCIELVLSRWYVVDFR